MEPDRPGLLPAPVAGVGEAAPGAEVVPLGDLTLGDAEVAGDAALTHDGVVAARRLAGVRGVVEQDAVDLRAVVEAEVHAVEQRAGPRGQLGHPAAHQLQAGGQPAVVHRRQDRGERLAGRRPGGQLRAAAVVVPVVVLAAGRVALHALQRGDRLREAADHLPRGRSGRAARPPACSTGTRRCWWWRSARSRLPSACSLSVGSPDCSSTIATNDAQVSRAYRSSAPAGAAGAAAGPAGAEGASSPVSSAAARIGTTARSSLVGRIASSFDRRHQRRAAHPMSRCRRLHCRMSRIVPGYRPRARCHAARHHSLVEEATTSSNDPRPSSVGRAGGRCRLEH